MNHSEPAVALDDIAQRLGLAISTVSRALRDMPGIHPATRDKVLKEANSLGYVAPRKKNAEAQPAPRNILMLTLGADAAPAGFLAGMSRAAVPFNFSLISHVASLAESGNILNPRHQPPSLRMGLVAGIVLAYKWPEEVAQILSRKWPTVSIIMHYPDLPIDVIGIDHVGGIHALVTHLQQTGHSKIGFFGLIPNASWSRSRFAAYAETMVSFGLPFSLENVIEVAPSSALVSSPHDDKEAYDRVVTLIRQGVKSWICANDAMAHFLCLELMKRGIRIPEEVAVTGFHQQSFTNSSCPELTTTEVSEEQIGAAALRRIAHRLDHLEETPRLILMPCHFHQGESTLAVPRAR